MATQETYSEKLYNRLSQDGLVTVGLKEFQDGLKRIDYRKKIYDHLSSGGLVTVPQNEFDSALLKEYHEQKTTQIPSRAEKTIEKGRKLAGLFEKREKSPDVEFAETQFGRAREAEKQYVEKEENVLLPISDENKNVIKENVKTNISNLIKKAERFSNVMVPFQLNVSTLDDNEREAVRQQVEASAIPDKQKSRYLKALDEMLTGEVTGFKRDPNLPDEDDLLYRALKPIMKNIVFGTTEESADTAAKETVAGINDFVEGLQKSANTSVLAAAIAHWVESKYDPVGANKKFKNRVENIYGEGVAPLTAQEASEYVFGEPRPLRTDIIKGVSENLSYMGEITLMSYMTGGAGLAVKPLQFSRNLSRTQNIMNSMARVGEQMLVMEGSNIAFHGGKGEGAGVGFGEGVGRELLGLAGYAVSGNRLVKAFADRLLKTVPGRIAGRVAETAAMTAGGIIEESAGEIVEGAEIEDLTNRKFLAPVAFMSLMTSLGYGIGRDVRREAAQDWANKTVDRMVKDGVLPESFAEEMKEAVKNEILNAEEVLSETAKNMKEEVSQVAQEEGVQETQTKKDAEVLTEGQSTESPSRQGEAGTVTEGEENVEFKGFEQFKVREETERGLETVPDYRRGLERVIQYLGEGGQYSSQARKGLQEGTKSYIEGFFKQRKIAPDDQGQVTNIAFRLGESIAQSKNVDAARGLVDYLLSLEADPKAENGFRQLAYESIEALFGYHINKGTELETQNQKEFFEERNRIRRIENISERKQAFRELIDKNIAKIWGEQYATQEGQVQESRESQREETDQGGVSAETSGRDLAEESRKVEEERTSLKKSLASRFREIERKRFGSATVTTDDLKRLRENASLLTKAAGLPALAQEKTFGRLSDAYAKYVTSLAQKSASTKNPIVRGIYGFMDSLFRNLPKQQESVRAGEKMIGRTNKAIEDAFNLKKSIDKLVENSAESLRKIDTMLDPDFYIESGEDVGVYQLTPDEKTAFYAIREILDWVHDANYAYGFISKETYEKNKGVYSARLYEPMELPEDQRDALSSKKINYGPYRHLEDLNDWKLENKIFDPSYMATKRLLQTITNMAITDYANHIIGQPGLVRESEADGFVKLSGKAYGPLDQKYVIQSVADDFRGFTFSNSFLNKLYDAFKSYDTWGPRQFYKKLFTVYNPGVHLGNLTSDNVFGFMVGVDPFSLNQAVWGRKGALSQVRGNGPIYRYALENGLLNTDIARSDFTGLMKKWETLPVDAAKEVNPFQWLGQAALDTYRATDDLYKLGAFMKLVEFGIEPETALNRVADGFQNYQRVGKMYDFMSKVPVVGKPFGKFSGDLVRMTQAAARTRPLQLAAFLGSIHVMAVMASIMSGEDPRDRKIREERSGFPKIPTPFGDIPLEFKVGGSTLNVARLVTPYFIYSDLNSDDVMIALARLFPFVPEYEYKTRHPGGIVAVNLSKNIEDPVLGPLLQLALNADFRGMPIWDPAETKDKPSSLTLVDKAVNSLRFLARSYVPYGSYGDDMVAALRDQEDYYGRQKNPAQVLSRFVGIRLELYADDRYGRILTQKLKSFGYDFVEQTKRHRVLNEQWEKGKIKLVDDFVRRENDIFERQAVIVSKARKFFEDNRHRLTTRDYESILREVHGITKKDIGKFSK